MKKVILSFVFILASFGLFAQNNYQNNISVNGTHKYGISPEYSVKMIVSMTNVYYDAETVSFTEIKSGYLDRLAKIGISSDRLKEDALHYSLMGYDKEGTVFEFKTKSLEEMQKFLNVRSIGVTKSDTNMNAELTEDQMANYAKAAFDNAKKKAEAIAGKIGRKIGKAIYISDSNTTKIQESLYYGSLIDSKEYYITVSFELL